MHQYNVWALFGSITIDITGPLLESKSRNRYLLIAMDYFYKWPEVCTIPSQEASTVVDALLTNFFYPKRVLNMKVKGKYPRVILWPRREE
jgi:hypothetical protein